VKEVREVKEVKAVDNNKNSSPFKGEVRRGMGATARDQPIAAH
jgi:hypothetical protein